MTRWTMSAVACAVSMIFAAPLWAQTPSPADQSRSAATTSGAPATPPPTATGATPPSSACASLTGTAREDCLSHENASNALCFGMNEKVRADCVKSYYPNDPHAQPSRPAAEPTRSEAPAGAGLSGDADGGQSGTNATGSGNAIQK